VNGLQLMYRSWAFFSTLLFLICSLLSVSPAFANSPGVFELLPGVVIDRESDLIFAMQSGNRVEAFSLTTGESIWSSEEAEKPLWVANDTLYAQTETRSSTGDLSVIALDTRSGRPVPGAFEILLPTGVEPFIDQERAKSFAIQMRSDALDLVVTWFYRDQSAVRVPFPDTTDQPIITETGGARIDTSNGSVQSVLVEPFWVAGSIIANVNNQPSGTGHRDISLLRWDGQSGDELSLVPVFSGPAVSQMASSDEQHLSIARLSGESVNGRLQYDWLVYSLESGTRIGSVTMNRSNQPFAVVDGALLHFRPPEGRRAGNEWVEEAPRIQLIDLSTGNILWYRDIRDVLYRGPAASELRGDR
jgi:hypothetical protein